MSRRWKLFNISKFIIVLTKNPYFHFKAKSRRLRRQLHLYPTHILPISQPRSSSPPSLYSKLQFFRITLRYLSIIYILHSSVLVFYFLVNFGVSDIIFMFMVAEFVLIGIEHSSRQFNSNFNYHCLLQFLVKYLPHWIQSTLVG